MKEKLLKGKETKIEDCVAEEEVEWQCINIKHRLVYQILENVQTVKIVSMWTNYEKI